MKRILFAAAFICAALAPGAGAQSPLGLTYPLGVPDLAVAGPSAAMGGSGTAVADEYMGAALNPANAAIGGRSVFSALVSFDMTSISDNRRSSSVSNYKPNLLSLILPIGAAGNLSFSMQKRYDANLNFFTREEYDNEDTTAVRTATIELHRKGGLTAWQAGWAYRFGNGIGLGVMYERLFFSRDSRSVFESVLAYNSYGGDRVYGAISADSSAVDFSGDAFRFGAQVPVHEKVTLGFAGEYPLPGNGNGKATINGGNAAAFSATLPLSFNFGAAYAMDARWLFAADFAITPWGEYYKNTLEPATANQCLGISAGARYIPAENVLSAKYWEKVHYGAGARYATLPNDRKLAGAREYALSVGAGLPIPRDGGMVDIVLSYGNRLDPRYSKYEESVVRLQLGLSGGRDWFQKDASKEY
jgi:hypothetical protein